MCSQTKWQFPTCSTLSLSWCKVGYSKYSLDITCWSRITGLILCVRDHHRLPFVPTFSLQWAPVHYRSHPTAPHWTCASAYTFSQGLCELQTARSCYKRKVRSSSTAFKKDSEKPDDNEVPGVSVLHLGRISRWQRNHLPHLRCRCQKSLSLRFSPTLVFPRGWLLFFLNWIVIGFKVPPHSVGPGKLQWKWLANFRYFCSVVRMFDIHTLNLKMVECNCYSCMIKAVSNTDLKYCRGYTQHAELYYFIVSSPLSCYLKKINCYMIVTTE